MVFHGRCQIIFKHLNSSNLYYAHFIVQVGTFEMCFLQRSCTTITVKVVILHVQFVPHLFQLHSSSKCLQRQKQITGNCGSVLVTKAVIKVCGAPPSLQYVSPGNQKPTVWSGNQVAIWVTNHSLGLCD